MLKWYGLASVLLWATGSFGAPAASYLDLNLRQNRYLGGVQHSAQTSNYTLFSGDLNLQTKTEEYDYKLNPIAQGAFESGQEFYFGVPEAYIQPIKTADARLTIGRAKRTWSRLDEEFNLGIWQPQLRWDYLAPIQQGLTGVFLDWNVSKSTRFTFFTSPLHLPDQGPQYRVNNGQFESSNRWFVQPHGRVQLFQGTKYSNEAPLYFELEKPTEEEVVMHSSFGLCIQHEFTDELWTQFNYAYKPRNQIHLGIECSNCANIGNPAPLEITAVIHPKIVKHHVATWEAGFTRVDDRGWLSLTGDFPNDSEFPEAYEEAALDDLLIAGAGYEHYIFEWLGRPSWLEYSYMHSFVLNREEQSGLVDEDQVQSSLDRYPYSEVAAIGWKLQLSRARKNQFLLTNRYNYSVPERGGWLSTQFDWVQGPVTFMLGMDILGAGVEANSEDAGLFSRYRANDRFYGGLGYVF